MTELDLSEYGVSIAEFDPDTDGGLTAPGVSEHPTEDDPDGSE